MHSDALAGGWQLKDSTKKQSSSWLNQVVYSTNRLVTKVLLLQDIS